jgi:hypothetical protein
MTESKKQRQFSDIAAKLEELSAKLDEVLRRIAPKEIKPPPVASADDTVQPANNPRSLAAAAAGRTLPSRIDPNLGSL